MNKLNHIAFIMTQWKEKKEKRPKFGHLKGGNCKKIVRLNKTKSTNSHIYVFSSENWRRPKAEINYLFKLIKKYFLTEIKNVLSQGIKINIFGELNKLPKDLNKILKKKIKQTKRNNRILVNLAINYGSKNEILLASKKVKKNINIKSFEKKTLYGTNASP